MKSSRFFVGLFVLVIVQVGTLAVFQRWEPARPYRDRPVVEAAEADAARVYAQALVAELRLDPDYELRGRLLDQAKLRAIKAVQQSRASPQHVVTVLAALSNIMDTPISTAYTGRRTDHVPRRQTERYQIDQQYQPSRGPPEMSPEARLRWELDNQYVPDDLNDISWPKTRRANLDQTF